MPKYMVKALVLGFGLFTAMQTQAVSAVSEDITLTISTFNGLASCWADPKYYPVNPYKGATPYGYLLTGNRIEGIKKEVDELKAAGVDVMCFQEMTDEMYGVISAELGHVYSGFMSYHDISYWAGYQLDPQKPVRNGNATFVNESKWQILSHQDVASYPSNGSGNHAVYTKIKSSRGSSRVFHVMNVHLDSDTGGRRKNELEGVLGILSPSFGSANDTQVLVGDFNCATTHASVQRTLSASEFINTKKPLEATHPFTVSYNNNQIYASIDHINVRNGTAVGDTAVWSHGLWVTYPFQNPNDPKEAMRIVDNFGICGSDHFPVVGSVKAPV